MALPYLSENAIVIMHDLVYHIFTSPISNVCALLFWNLQGEKILPAPYRYYMLDEDITRPWATNTKYQGQNIGLCRLDRAQNVEKYFRLLTFPWVYMPKDEDLRIFSDFVKRHYGAELAEFFEGVINFQRDYLTQNRLRYLIPKAIKHKILGIKKQILG